MQRRPINPPFERPWIRPGGMVVGVLPGHVRWMQFGEDSVGVET